MRPGLTPSLPCFFLVLSDQSGSTWKSTGVRSSVLELLALSRLIEVSFDNRRQVNCVASFLHASTADLPSPSSSIPSSSSYALRNVYGRR